MDSPSAYVAKALAGSTLQEQPNNGRVSVQHGEKQGCPAAFVGSVRVKAGIQKLCGEVKQTPLTGCHEAIESIHSHGIRLGAALKKRLEHRVLSESCGDHEGCLTTLGSGMDIGVMFKQVFSRGNVL